MLSRLPGIYYSKSVSDRCRLKLRHGRDDGAGLVPAEGVKGNRHASRLERKRWIAPLLTEARLASFPIRN